MADARQALKRHIEEALSQRGRLIFAIDGMTGSGKSRLAIDLADQFGGSIIRMDHFFLPVTERDQPGTPVQAGHMDLARFQEEVMLPLTAGHAGSYRVFNCQRQQYSGERSFKGDGLIIVEGSYALHPEIRALYDDSVFLSLDAGRQRARLQAREGNFYAMFEAEWLPREQRYHATIKPQEAAGSIIDMSEVNDTIVYLVRHGLTNGNVTRMMQGHTDIPLNETGFTQAEKLAARLQDYRFNRAFASDLTRAQQTAETVLFNHPETPLTLTAAIREMNFGDLDGCPFDVCLEQYPEVFENMREAPLSVVAPGGETGERVRDRALAFVNQITREHHGDVMLMVSHGFILNLMMQGLAEIHQLTIPTTIFDNTAFSKLVFNGGRLIDVPLINSIDHLRETSMDGDGNKQ